MEFKLLNHDNGERTYALIFDEGDEMMEGLKNFVAAQDIDGASFTAIGAFQRATLGFFDMDEKEYKPIPIDEQVEVLSLMGNVGIHVEKNEPKIHAHVVVGKRDGAAMGGHVLEAHVRPTLEVVLIETPQFLQRRTDEKTGLALIDLASAHSTAHA